MLFAVIGDIQGDLHALEAALDHVESAGIQLVMHTGNAIVGGPDGDAVIERLRAAHVRAVLGNQDRLAVRFSKKRRSLGNRLDPHLFAALEEAHTHTRSGNLEFLGNLRTTQHIEIDNLVLYLCAQAGNLPPGSTGAALPTARLRRLREEALADVILCGGAPEPFATTVDGTLIVFPGPLHAGPGAVRYALVDTEEAPFTATFPRVAVTP